MDISTRTVPEPVLNAVTASLCLAVIVEVVVDMLSVKAFTVLAVAAALGLIRMLGNSHAGRIESAIRRHTSCMETSVQQHQEGLSTTVLAGERVSERAHEIAMRGALKAHIDAMRGADDRNFGADTGPFPVVGRGK
jgi:hypothetical protein